MKVVSVLLLAVVALSFCCTISEAARSASHDRCSLVGEAADQDLDDRCERACAHDGATYTQNGKEYCNLCGACIG